jgi:glycosyltransferase involved in cell wall biosynthesis
MFKDKTDFRMNPIRLIAIIVLYEMKALDSISYKTLLASASNIPLGSLNLKILLYDNTPTGIPPDGLPQHIKYYKGSRNNGLAEAYNTAAEVAASEGYEWLLTLDQDTSLPLHFLSRVAEIATEIADRPAIAAIVPQIIGGDRMLSPNWFWQGAIPRWFIEGYVGIPTQTTFAFNSASTIRVSALRQVGGYNPLFWLDSSDHNIFRQFSKFGKYIYIAGDIQVDHDFSMLATEHRMSPERYRNILLAETAFWDREMGFLAGFERTFRLANRYLQQIRSKSDMRLRNISAEFLRRRVFWSRRKRIAAWKNETLQLFPDLPTPGERAVHERVLSDKDRPKVSVCMAAYNGEKYVEQQLQSILSQLGSQDEVIIVDDKSTDRTRDKILSIVDPRIHMVWHSTNCGVVATFEDAVRNATGDVIFLADDDDIWAPEKVAKVLDVFRQNESVKIVLTAISVINQEGNISADTIYSNRKKFNSGFWANVLMNHYQGSAMAFRSTLLTAILPFPKNVGFLHDAWIGTRNARRGGKVAYIDTPLLFYRRHPDNYSRKMSPLQRLKTRLQLLLAHALAD